jgi:hypothetical protein
MTLQALRRRIGQRAFTTLIRRWVALHRHGTAQVGQFTALAEQVSHQQLDGFFRAWLYTSAKPAETADNGFPAAAAGRRFAGAAPRSHTTAAARSDATAPAGVVPDDVVTADVVPDATARATLDRLRRGHQLLSRSTP